MPLGDYEEYQKQFEANLNLARNNLAKSIAERDNQTLGGYDITDVNQPIPEDYYKAAPAKGVSGYISQFGSGLGQVVAGLPALAGLAEKIITGKQLKDTYGGSVAQAIEDFTSAKNVDPAIQESFSGKVATGLGQAVGFLAGGRAGGASKIGMAANMAAGAGMGGKALYDDAISKGADEDTAYSAALQGTLLGTTDALPFLNSISRFLGSNSRGLLRTLGSAALTGGEELLQEGLQTLGENTVAKVTAGYDPDRAWMESVSESAGVGGATGFIADLVLNTIGKRLHGGPTLKVDKGENGNLTYSVDPESDLGKAYEIANQKKIEGEKNREKLFDSLDYNNIPNLAAQARGEDTNVYTDQDIAKSAAKLNKYINAVPGSIAAKIKEENIGNLATNYIFNPTQDVHKSREAIDALASVGLPVNNIERLKDRFLKEVDKLQGEEDSATKIKKLQEEYASNLDNLSYPPRPNIEAPLVDSSSADYINPAQQFTIQDQSETASTTQEASTADIILNGKGKPYKKKDNTNLKIAALKKQGTIAESVELPNGKGWGIRVVSTAPTVTPTSVAEVTATSPVTALPVQPITPVQQATAPITETPPVTPAQDTAQVAEPPTIKQEANKSELVLDYPTGGGTAPFATAEAAKARIDVRQKNPKYKNATVVDIPGGYAIQLNPEVQQPTEVTPNGQETSINANEVQQQQVNANEVGITEGQKQGQGLLKTAKPKAPRKSKSFAVKKNIQVEVPFTPVSASGDPVFKAGGTNPTTGRLKHDGTNFQLELENGTWITPDETIQKRLQQHKAVDAAMPRAGEGQGTTITEPTQKEMAREEDRKAKILADEETRAKMEVKFINNLNDQLSDDQKLDIINSINQAQDNAAAGVTDNIKGELTKKYGINLPFNGWVKIANGLRLTNDQENQVGTIQSSIQERQESQQTNVEGTSGEAVTADRVLQAPEILELASPPAVAEPPIEVSVVPIKPSADDLKPKTKPKVVRTPRKPRKPVVEDEEVDEFAETNKSAMKKAYNLDEYSGGDETTLDDLADIGFTPFDDSGFDYKLPEWVTQYSDVQKRVMWKQMIAAIDKFKNAVYEAGNNDIDFVIYKTREEFQEAVKNDPTLQQNLFNLGDTEPKGWRRIKPNGREEVAILAFKHDSDIDVARTLLHETVGHYGMEKMFGNRWLKFLERTADTNPKILRQAYNKLAKTYGTLGKKVEGRYKLKDGEYFVTDINGNNIAVLNTDEVHKLLKEYIAKLSEEYTNPATRARMEKGALAYIKRTYAYLKHIIRSLVNFEVTEEDIHALIRESYARVFKEEGVGLVDNRILENISKKYKNLPNEDLGNILPVGRMGYDYVAEIKDYLSGNLQGPDQFQKDMDNQIKWLDERAQGLGFKDTQELMEKDINSFVNFASQWREQNPLFSLARRTKQRLQSYPQYGRIDPYKSDRVTLKHYTQLLQREEGILASQLINIDGIPYAITATLDTSVSQYYGIPYVNIAFATLKDTVSKTISFDKAYAEIKNTRSPMATKKAIDKATTDIINFATNSGIGVIISGANHQRFRIYENMIRRKGFKYKVEFYSDLIGDDFNLAVDDYYSLIDDLKNPKANKQTIEKELDKLNDLLGPTINIEPSEDINWDEDSVSDFGLNQSSIDSYANNEISFSIAANPQELADAINEPVENVIGFHEMTKNHERQIPLLSGFSSFMKKVQKSVDTSTKGVFDLFGNVANSGRLKTHFRNALGYSSPAERLSRQVTKIVFNNPKIGKTENREIREAWLNGSIHDGTFKPSYLTSIQIAALQRLSRELAKIQQDVAEGNFAGISEETKKKIIDSKGRWLHQDYLSTMDKGYIGHGWLTSALDWQKKRTMPEGSGHLSGAIADSRYSIMNSINLLARDSALLQMYDNIIQDSDKLGTHWVINSKGKHDINGTKYTLQQIRKEINDLESYLNESETVTLLTPQEEVEVQNKLKTLVEAEKVLDSEELLIVREAMIRSGHPYSKLDMSGNPILNENGKPIGDNLTDLYSEGWQAIVNKYRTEQYVFIHPKKFKNMGNLRGYWLDKRIYDVIFSESDYITNASKNWASTIFNIGPGSTLDRANSLWKGQMTVMNPVYWIRNFIGAGVVMDLASNTNSATLTRYLIEETHNAFIKEPGESQPLYGGKTLSQWALEKGLFSTGFSANELYAIRYELKKSGATDSFTEMWKKGEYKESAWALGGIMKNGYFELAKTLANLNINFDAMFKMALMRDYLEIHAKQNGFTSATALTNAYNKESKAKLVALMENAAAYAGKGVFEYHDIPRWMQTLRRVPLGAPFLTFNYKMFGAVQRAALARPWKLAKYQLAGYAIFQALMAASDWDEEELKKAMDSLPIHMRNKSSLYIIPYKDNTGNVHYADLSYILPQAFIYDTFLKMANPTPGQSQIGAVGTTLAETTGILSGPIPKVLTAIIAKKDPFTGRDLWVDGDSFDSNLARYSKFMWNLAAPPWAHADLFEAGTGGGIINDTFNANFKDEFGKDKNPYWTTDFASLSGANIKTYRPQDQSVRNMKYITSKVKDIEMQRSKVMKNNNLDREEKIAKLRDFAERIKELNLSRSKYSGL